jgi:hypothetical protein
MRSLHLSAVIALLLFTRAASAASGSGPTLSARASVYSNSLGLKSWSTLITLTIPFDRSVRPALPLAAEPAVAEDAGATGTDDAVTESKPLERPLVLTPKLARATVRAALRAGGRAGALRRLDSLSARSKSSALLPELRLRGERVVDESLRLTPRIDDPYRYTRAGGTSLELEARLTWRLSRLVFADDEIAVERLRVARAAVDARRVTRVLSALGRWQKALLIAADEAENPRDRLLAELSAVEAEVELDVLTDGWFSARIRRLPGAKGLADRGTTE